MKILSTLFALLAVAALPLHAQNPTITTIVEAAGQTPPGFPNYGIPPGGAMKITGFNLGPATEVANYPAFPLGSTLAAVSVNIRSGQTDYTALMMSAQANTVFAIIPSEVPLGNATVTLSNDGRTSAPFNIRVADIAGIFTLNGRSAGPALILNSRFEPVTLINPARPGETVLLLLNARTPAANQSQVGLTAELDKIGRAMQGERFASDDSRQAPTFGNLFLGDTLLTIITFGRLFPGLAYAVVQLPTSPSNACWTALRFRNELQILSNIATISIADSSRNVCTDPIGPNIGNLFGRAKPGPFPFSVIGTFNRFDLKRDYGGQSTTGGVIDVFITKGFYEEGPIDFQAYKDSFQTTYGCYSETFFRPRPSQFPTAGFINLGPAIELIRDPIVERINRGSNSTYFVTTATNPLSPFGPIIVDVDDLPGIPGSGYRVGFDFPFSLPITPLRATIVGGTINPNNDLRIQLTNVPNRTDHHIFVTFNLPLVHLNAGITTTCRFMPGPEVVIPKEYLALIPDSASNLGSITVIHQPNHPYANTTPLPDDVGYADAADRIYTVISNLPFRNPAP